MTAPELLSYLRGLGVELSKEGERLRVNAPAGVLTPALREQVSASKAEILSFLDRVARSSALPAAAVPPIVPVPRIAPPPLSFAQQRLWFLDQLEPGSPVYNIPTAFRLSDFLHPDLLAEALGEIVRRHEVLRTTFQMVKGEPAQVIAPPAPVPLPVIDLSSLPATDRAVEEASLLTAEARRPFDLGVGPLLRACLLHLAEGDTVVLNMHHAVSDGWSLEILLREIVVLYEAFQEGRPSPLPELPIQYADYACWQRQWLQGSVLEAELAVWRQRLEGVPLLLDLPADRPRPPVQGFRGATRKFQTSEGLAPALLSLTRERGATLFMTLLAAFQVLLHRMSGQDDILVGTPIAGRHRAETEGLIGLFVNTLVLRADLSGNPRFVDLLERAREATLEAYQHQDLPFEKLVEELRPERSLGHSPLVQVIFGLQNFQGATYPGQGLRRLGIGTGMAKLDLAAMVTEAPGRLLGGFEHSLDLFDGATIQRMVEHFLSLLHGIVARPETRVADLPLLTAAERQQLLQEWNDTGVPAREDLLHTLFEAQVARTPEAVAVVCGARRLSYRELDRRAGALAARLCARGVGPEEVVGLCLDRSGEMVAALLGILKAGAAYLPLDPAYPRERLAFMIGDAGARKVVTQGRWAEALPVAPGLEILPVDTLSGEPETVSSRRGPPDGLAYLIYTSGSTGQPKGVAISHRSAVALIDWSRKVFGEEEIAAVLASTSINFDLSVFELFVPLSRGGTVVLVDDALALIDRAAGAEVTLLNTVPSALNELLQAEALPASARTLNLAGEPLRASLVRQIYRQSSIQRVYNLYGPSEDTTYSTWARIDRSFEGEPGIGRPISGTRACVLDRSGHPVPIGVPGELFLGGAGLARGYLGRPDLTAERFVPDPFSAEPGARLYRSGDSVRSRPDGRLEFLGRLDTQVKIRGFRIEPGEVEAALSRHPGVHAVVVVARARPQGPLELAACLVAEGDPPSAEELRRLLAEHLPGHMIPSSFTFLEELPRTASGKIDRKAAAALSSGGPGRLRTYVPPADPAESVLVEIWQQVLGRETVGVEDNFFELGGDSLKAIRVLTGMRKRGLQAAVRDLFKDQTIRAFVRRHRSPAAPETLRHFGFEPAVLPVARGDTAGLDRAEAALRAHPALAAAHLVPGRYRGEEIVYCFYRFRPGARLSEPELDAHCRATLDASQLPSRFIRLSPIAGHAPGEVDRERLERFLDHDIVDLYELGPSQDWFFAQPWLHPGTFVVHRGRTLEVRLDPGALRKACRALLQRHQILNTVFPDPLLARCQLLVRPPEAPPFDLHDLTGLDRDQQRQRVASHTQAVVDAIRLDRWPLCRFLLFRTGRDQWYFLFVCHHLLCDELSVEILAEDLFDLYRRALAGALPPSLPPARNLYRDCILWLRQTREEGRLEESLRFWRRELPEAVPFPTLPVDFPDALNAAALRERCSIQLGRGETERLERNALARFAAPLAAVFCAIAARAVARWSGNREVILVDIHHGRVATEEIDLEKAIGFLAIGTPIRVPGAGDHSFDEVVRRIADRLESMPLPVRVHYNYLWQDLPNHFNFDPAAHKVVVNYFSGTRPGLLDDAGLYPTLENRDILHSLIEMFVASPGGALRFSFVYSRGKLAAEAMARLAGFLREDLAELAAG